MTWMAISDGRRVFRDIDPVQFDPNGFAPEGSLLIELPFLADTDRRQDVILLDKNAGWRRRFRMTLGAKGDLLVEHQQGAVITHALVKFSRPDPESMLRIMLSWDAPSRIGIISVENLDSGNVAQTVLEEPLPWSIGDLSDVVTCDDGVTLDPGITLLAVADRIEAVGLHGGFALGTFVDTPQGSVKIETVKSGDLVLTSEHGYQPVRHAMSYTVPAIGRFAPVRLQAPAFGITDDLVVAPDHRLLVAGADAEYLFGSDSVLLEARYLARMSDQPRRHNTPTITYCQLLLDAHVCISACGTWGESYFFGDLPDHPMRFATSILSGVSPSDLPRHTRIANPELQGYEAMVLVSAISA